MPDEWDSNAWRREELISLRDAPFEDTKKRWLYWASAYDGKDRFYLEALGIGSDGKEEALYPLMLSDLGHADPLKWSDAFADLVWRLHPVACIPAVAARAQSSALPPAARRQAVDSLAFIKHADAASVMAHLALHGPPDVKEHALWWVRFRAGNDWRDFEVSRWLKQPAQSTSATPAQAQAVALRKQLLDPQASKDERASAATSLAATKEGGLLLLQLAAEQKLSKELTDLISEEIFRNPDLGVRALASQHFRRPSRTGEAFPPVAELLQRRGDPERGRQAFLSDTAGCAQCHRYGEAGSDIGPDLSVIRTKLDKAGLLDSILNPSAAIAFGYEAWLVTLKNGETYSGFILAEGETVVLKEVSGERRALPGRDIASRQKQTLSIMPDNIALGLTPQELVDVVEFLLAGAAQERK
jgi:putative heme-binding domain-containing protein